MYYPQIENLDSLTNALKLVVRKFEEDPNYFDHPDCPYSADFIALISTKLATTKVVDDELGDDSEIDIALEATVLFNDMKKFKKDLKHGDIAEQASMFRTLTSLMEKLINIRERASAVKNFQLFERLIFEMIDGYLSPQQRTEFLDRVTEIKN